MARAKRDSAGFSIQAERQEQEHRRAITDAYLNRADTGEDVRLDRKDMAPDAYEDLMDALIENVDTYARINDPEYTYVRYWNKHTRMVIKRIAA